MTKLNPRVRLHYVRTGSIAVMYAIVDRDGVCIMRPLYWSGS